MVFKTDEGSSMKRRNFLLASGAVAILGTSALLYRSSTVVIPSIESATGDLSSLKARRISTKAGWPPFKVFSHLAQSIEYSMTGYPSMKPALFQRTVGSAAFYAFSIAGAMRHDLTEPIPGAPDIPGSGDVSQAIDRLISALVTFDSHSGPLHPHFAYGALTKARYANAHVMHIGNHLSDVVAG